MAGASCGPWAVVVCTPTFAYGFSYGAGLVADDLYIEPLELPLAPLPTGVQR
jgi:hypothetical protein